MPCKYDWVCTPFQYMQRECAPCRLCTFSRHFSEVEHQSVFLSSSEASTVDCNLLKSGDLCLLQGLHYHTRRLPDRQSVPSLKVKQWTARDGFGDLLVFWCASLFWRVLTQMGRVNNQIQTAVGASFSWNPGPLD